MAQKVIDLQAILVYLYTEIGMGVQVTRSTELVAICAKPASPQDLERAALHVLDWVGIAIATRGTPPEQQFGKTMGMSAGALAAFDRARHGPDAAAFALGALGSLLELDDLHRPSILHAGDVVCPAALVVGLANGVTGLELLRSVLAGYEVALRIGEAAASGGYTSWYNSGTCGVFGAAMAASVSLGLDASAQAHALGHAGMQAAGLWQCRLEPGHAKQLAAAHATRAGITAARTARAGLAAPLEILEGDLGFFATLYPAADARDIAADPQARWRLHDVSFKPWSCCRHTHPAIAAALEVRARIPGAENLREVSLRTYGAALAFCDNPAPATAHESRFSLQHCIAIALSRGAPSRTDFEDPDLRDTPDISTLRKIVSVLEDPAHSANFPFAYGASLTVLDHHGTRHTANAPHAPGDPEAPLTPQQLHAKFLANCQDGSVPETLAQALLDAIVALPETGELSTLANALAAVANLEHQRRNA
jgi:2-methylcitrate dehydratase PrpD